MSTSLSRRSTAAAHPTRQQLDELDALLKRMLDLPVKRPEDEADGDPPAPIASAPEPMRGPHRPPSAPKRADEPAVNYTTPDEEEADLKPRVVTDAPKAAAPADLKPRTDRPEDWVPLTSTWQPSARTWKPLTDAWKQAQASASRPADSVPPAIEEDEPSLAAEPAPSVEHEAASAERENADVPPSTAAPPPEPAVPAAAPEAPPLKELPPLTVTPSWTLWPLVAFNAGFDICLALWGTPGRWLRGRAGRMVLGVVGLACLAAAAGLAFADWIGWTW